jgi:hypothetical protein
MKDIPFIRKTIFIAICMASLAFISGCHHPKNMSESSKATPSISPSPEISDPGIRALLTQLRNSEPSFREMSARMKTKVTSPSLNQSFTTNIRWKKGEKIWMSMSIIGIEGARVLITPDSIKIMDKLNERYIFKPISYIREKTFVDLSFSDIENLLLGQLIFTDTSKAKYSDKGSSVILTSDGARFLTHILFDKPTKNLQKISVSDKMYVQTIESTYENYQPQYGRPFSMDRNIKISSGGQVFELNCKIQSVEFNDNLDYPFTINPGYRIER